MQKGKIDISTKALFIPFLLLFVCFPNTKAEQYLYTRLSNDNRTMTNIHYMFNEKNKFLWIATNKGVYRFNGYEFKHYHSENKNNNIPGDYVYRIMTDSIGNFWALTNKGACLYQEMEDRFELVKSDSIGENPARSFCHVQDGILFACENKILKYDYSSRKIEQYVDCSDEDSLSIKYMYKFTDNEIILNSENKVMILDIKNKEIKKNIFRTEDPISCIFVDSNQKIWIAYFNHGIITYDAKGNEIDRYNKENGMLSSNVVLCMQQQDSLIWAGTEGGGISIINTNNNTTRRIQHVIGDTESFPANSVHCLIYDNYNTMWAGNIKDGIIRIKKSGIKTYDEVPLHAQNGLSNSSVLYIYPDKDEDKIWIATDGEGINSMHLKSKKFKHYNSTLGTKVISIADYSDNELILSLYLKGLQIFNKHTGTLRPLDVRNSEIENMLRYTRSAIDLYNEDKDNILIYSDKVYRYNLKTHKAEEIANAAYKNNVNRNLQPIGTRKDYFYLYDEESVYRLKHGESSIERVFKTNKLEIISASLDSDGLIWIATNKGIATYSVKESIFRRIPSNLFDIASSILPDNKGRVWIGAGTKLYTYQIKEKSFAMFGESDGAYPNEYIRKARIVTKDGNIIMGGTRGLLVIDNTFDIDASETPKLTLADVYIDGKQVKKSQWNNTHTIKVPWGSKQYEFQISTIERDMLRPKVYKYTISGPNCLVIESFSPRLTLSSLEPGKNTIHVSCGTRKGEWTTPVRIITFDVQLPWYKTLWFNLTCLLVSVIILSLGSYTLLKIKGSKMKIKMKEHEKDVFEEKVVFLTNINHELRTPLTLIHSPLKRILQQMNPSDKNFPHLNKIYRQAGRMKKLLNMVLDLRKMETGDKCLYTERIKANDWLKNIVDDFVDEGNTAGITIRLEQSDDIEHINFDKEKCEIVITNMLVNAIKHSNKGDTITLKTELTDKSTIRVSVIDEGIGIDEEDLDKLFIRYYQGGQEKYGYGIGMAYSKVLIELHKGNIGAYNNDKGGATFFFEIPTNLELGKKECEISPRLNDIFAPQPKITGKSNLSADDYDTSKCTLLIVDDSNELTDFIKDAFIDKFNEIYVASNGNEALSIMEKAVPSIIVSDIMMPEMDGYELCKRVKTNEMYIHIPFIMLTARNDEKSEQRGYKLGADAFIEKPFEIETLYEIIKSKLKGREIIRQKYMQMSILPEAKEENIGLTDEIFLQKLNTIIRENISNNELDIPFICKEIGMSRASLYNKMKALTDMGGNEYINKIRMEKAMMLIKTTNMSITDVSAETGFTTLKYFSTTFKNYTGMTPTQFKKTHSKKSAKESDKHKYEKGKNKEEQK